MSLLAPTPPDHLVDAKRRRYFLWDEGLTLDVFRARLADPDPPGGRIVSDLVAHVIAESQPSSST